MCCSFWTSPRSRAWIWRSNRCASDAFAGRTLADIDIRHESGVVILAIRKANGEMLFNPSPEMQMSAGDHLIAMGDARHLQKLEQLLMGAVSA